MLVPVYNRQKMERLEQLILTVDFVLFFLHTKDIQFFQQGICLENIEKNIFVILGNNCCSCCDAPFIKRISKENTEKLIRLYYMYEFTDNFYVITDNNGSVPNIFNYVKTGLLTLQEAWQALLS